MLATTWWLHRPTDRLRAAQNAYSAIKVQAIREDAGLQAFELEVPPRLAISDASLVHPAQNQSSAIAEVIHRCIDDKASAAESTSQHVDRLSIFPTGITVKKITNSFYFAFYTSGLKLK
jgi:hypothetical protein